MSTINPGALGAYNAASQLGAGMSGSSLNTVADAGKTDGPSFGDLLKTATQGAINTQKASETASAQAVLGKADLTDVVSAVNNAEVSLNLFIGIRDKIIDAYNQIQRTQI
jgi:flagellar hook-basal body complex protein FliE